MEWITNEVLGSGGPDAVIDDRQNRALVNGARTIAQVLGPGTTGGYRGRALNFAASRSVDRLGSPEPAWRPYLRAVEHHVVSAEHQTMMTADVMEQAGPILREALADAREDAT